MNAFSVVVITLNEAGCIRDCLESVRWCDDIVVVDSGSSDGTPDICREFTPRVFFREWHDHATQKNWGIQQVRHPWVLSMDADERVSPGLRAEIQVLTPDDSINGYLIPFRNYLGTRWMRYGGLYPDLHLRLFRKEKSRFTGSVHEQITVPGKTAVLHGDILHHTYADWSDYLDKINRYTSLQAEELYQSGVRPRWIMFRAMAHFLRAFIRHSGWRDGTFGLLYSALIGLYPLVLYAKLWEKGTRR